MERNLSIPNVLIMTTKAAAITAIYFGFPASIDGITYSN